MSRNKNRNQSGKLGHAGYTIESGHGGLKRNQTGYRSAGSEIKPRSEEASGVTRTKARKQQPASSAQQEASRTPTTEAAGGDKGSGWEAIGKAGGEIASTAIKRRKAKQAEQDDMAI